MIKLICLQAHPRTAVGLKDDQLYFIIVEGVDGQGGCTPEELQEIGKQLGLRHFLNLDGGGSSQFRLWHEGRYIRNNMAPEDEQRVLGHVIALFDEALKT